MRIALLFILMWTNLSAQGVLDFTEQFTFSENGNGRFIDEITNSQGDYFLIRNSSHIVNYNINVVQVYKTDSAFNLLWKTDLGYVGSLGGQHYICPANDGGCYAGFTFSDSISLDGETSFDYIVYKINSDGSIAWEKLLGSNGNENGYISFLETSDNSLLFAGAFREINGTFSDSSVFHEVEVFDPFGNSNYWMSPYVIAELDINNGQILNAFAPYDSIHTNSYLRSQLFGLEDNGYVLITQITNGSSIFGEEVTWMCQGNEALTYKRYSADHQLISSYCIPELVVTNPNIQVSISKPYRINDYIHFNWQPSNSNPSFVKFNLLTGELVMTPLLQTSGPQVFLDDGSGNAIGIGYNADTSCTGSYSVQVLNSAYTPIQNFCSLSPQIGKVVQFNDENYLYRTIALYPNGVQGGCYLKFNLNGSISGRFFLDENSDGIYDQGEKGINAAKINYTGPEGNGSVWNIPDGSYHIPAKQGSYSLGIQTLPWFETSLPAASVQIDQFYENKIHDFPMSAISDVTELQIELVPQIPVIDSIWSVSAIIRNSGTLSADAKFSIILPAAVNFSAASVDAIVSGNSIVLNPGVLPSLESTVVKIFFETLNSSDFLPGDSIVLLASLDIISDEINSNNSSTIHCKVLTDEHSNNISHLRGNLISFESVQQQEPFKYLVTCQNDFEFPANNLRIQNLLNSQFDYNSLKVLATSHPIKAIVNNSNKVEFVFQDLELPSSMLDENGSKAWILFEINPLLPLSAGDVVTHKMRVGFDYYLPLFTNTDSTYIEFVTGSEEFTQEGLLISPNPTHGNISINLNQNNRLGGIIEISGLEGKLIQKIDIKSGVNDFNWSLPSLETGIYFIRFLSKESGCWLAQKVVVISGN